MTTITLDMQALSPVRTGLWCDACALPSMTEADFVISSGRMTLLTLTLSACEDCGACQQVRRS